MADLGLLAINLLLLLGLAGISFFVGKRYGEWKHEEEN